MLNAQIHYYISQLKLISISVDCIKRKSIYWLTRLAAASGLTRNGFAATLPLH